MKIYILPINKKFKLKTRHIKYPKHNSDFGVEQDFYKFIKKNKQLTTKNIKEANFHYLPIYWTRWHITHEYAKKGLTELQAEASKSIIDDKKTFTICQYDDGPIINLGKTIQFLASRKTKEGFDIPLLCKKHNAPFFLPKKKYTASFLGRLKTHPIRNKMNDSLKNNKQFFINDGNKGTRFFIKKMLESYVALSPRGYGGSSFRLFEAMQLGIVPFLISDIDTRPYKNFIDWKSCSFFTDDPKKIITILNSINYDELILMGKKCKKIYTKYLSYQNWCEILIKELKKYGK